MVLVLLLQMRLDFESMRKVIDHKFVEVRLT